MTPKDRAMNGRDKAMNGRDKAMNRWRLLMNRRLQPGNHARFKLKPLCTALLHYSLFRCSLWLMMATGACFSLLYLLYGLPWEAVLYGWLLAAFISLLMLLVKHLADRRTIESIRRLAATPARTAYSVSILPAPRDPLDGAFLDLIAVMLEQEEYLRTGLEHTASELMDSYSLWVHQIKTPIAALNLMLQTEQDSAKNRAMRLELFKIEQYAELALHLLRLEGDGTDLLLEKQDLRRMVTDAIRKYRSLFIEKRLSLRMEVADTTVLGDAKWTAVILEQVLSNAIKYTATGEVSVISDPESPETIIIGDTGIGIRPEDQPRVFERGFTGFNGRTDLRATGIGLYLARRACDRLGIGISLQSEIGVGTKVRLSFPPCRNGGEATQSQQASHSHV